MLDGKEQGGWSFDTYNKPGNVAVRFTAENAINLNLKDIYSIGSYKFSIEEINIISGIGNIRCLFDASTPYDTNWDATSKSGALLKTKGNGQANISYTSWIKENKQPFWNANTNSFDILDYKDNYCNGHIDIICILLGINSLLTRDIFDSVDVVLDTAETLVHNIHDQLPNTRILISTIPLPSPKGGIAANYGAGNANGMYNFNGFNHKVYNFNNKLNEIMSRNHSEYVTVVSTHTQFDSYYSYPTTEKPFNTRTSDLETLQTNAVHPSNTGYWQIADALGFRSILGIISNILS